MLKAPIHPSLTIVRVVEACKLRNNIGFCINCGIETDGLFPGRAREECENCGGWRSTYRPELLLKRLNNVPTK